MTLTHCEASCIRLVQLFLGVWPVLLAIWVAMTRVRDYRHDTTDVLAGHLIGMMCAVQCHAAFYHSVKGPKAGLPLGLLEHPVTSHTQMAEEVQDMEELTRREAHARCAAP